VLILIVDCMQSPGSLSGGTAGAPLCVTQPQRWARSADGQKRIETGLWSAIKMHNCVETSKDKVRYTQSKGD